MPKPKPLISNNGYHTKFCFQGKNATYLYANFCNFILLHIYYLGVDCGMNALLLEGGCEKVNSALREKTFFIYTRQLQGIPTLIFVTTLLLFLEN